MQQKLRVTDQIESWISNRLVAWRESSDDRPLLILLSGNAGDGKSDLIEGLRPDISAHGDVDVVADATHAEQPSATMAQRLRDEFGPFADDARKPPKRALVIAMNVGMVTNFFDALGEERTRFAQLERLLTVALGLNAGQREAPEGWLGEVVNLDKRNLLGSEAGEGLLSGMLDRVAPEHPQSAIADAARACSSCPARPWCWARTNLTFLADDTVRQKLSDALWAIELSGSLHLSPRLAWDMLARLVTGGHSVLGHSVRSCDDLRRLADDAALTSSIEWIDAVDQRLLPNLLFEWPDGQQAAGPVLSLTPASDPLGRTGSRAHALESRLLADPEAHVRLLEEAATHLDEPDTAAGRRPDPLLLSQVNAFGKGRDEELASALATTALRRAALMGSPADVADELADREVGDFRELMRSYASWSGSPPAPPDVAELYDLLVKAIAEMFGFSHQQQTYFALDTFSPASRFSSYVAVKLEERFDATADAEALRAAPWLQHVHYVPRAFMLRIGDGKHSWDVPADLPLYRLAKRVRDGYVASTADLETFFRLRYACERLGSSAAADTEMLYRDIRSGAEFRLSQKKTGIGAAKPLFERIS